MLGQKSEKIKARTEITALKDSGHLPTSLANIFMFQTATAILIWSLKSYISNGVA